METIEIKLLEELGIEIAPKYVPNVSNSNSTYHAISYNPTKYYNPFVLALLLTKKRPVQVRLYQDRYIHTPQQIRNVFEFAFILQKLQYKLFEGQANIVKTVITTTPQSFFKIKEFLQTKFPGKTFGLKGGIFAINNVPMIFIKKANYTLPGERQFIFYEKLHKIEWQLLQGQQNKEIIYNLIKPNAYYCNTLIWKATRSWDFTEGSRKRIKSNITYTQALWEDRLPNSTKVVGELLPFLFTKIN